jgi:hypothetical protein
VIEITEVLESAGSTDDDPQTVDLTDPPWSDVDPVTGEIRFDGPPAQVGDLATFDTVTYSYGYTETPIQVKVPVIMATASRLTMLNPSATGKRKFIPPNTTSYTTQGTTFRLQPVDPAKAPVPWPWDQYASADIRSWWGPARPRALGTRVGG